MTRRITPEEVVAAYKRTGIRPGRYTFQEYGDGNRAACRCGITVLIPGTVPSTCGQIAAAVGISLRYLEGFTWGFDGSSVYMGEPEGYEDGRAAAAAVEAAGLEWA